MARCLTPVPHREPPQPDKGSHLSPTELPGVTFVVGHPRAEQAGTAEEQGDIPPPPEWLRQDLCALLPEVAGTTWTGLRGGRVNRCWRAGGLVVKAYRSDGSSPMFPNDPVAEAMILRHLDGRGIAPRLRATGPEWIAYDHIEGRIWREGGDPNAVAMLFRHVWTTPPPKELRLLASGSAALCDGAALLADAPLLPGASSLDIPPVEPQLIHGDAVFGNIISGPSGVRLIDWQCPALGDPAEDVAAFLSPAMRWLYGGLDPDPELEPRFLACLPEEVSGRYRRLKPLFHWRMMQHCQWKLRHGHADYGPALDRERAAFQYC